MVASNQNDILTLLNLACIKYTGCPLPVSEFSANNWKYELDEKWCDVAGSILTKKAKWSPHPYFNPIHLYYPSYDFGARVLRSLVVAEIDFILNGERKLREQILKLSNPFNYKVGRQGARDTIPCQAPAGGRDLDSREGILLSGRGFQKYENEVISFSAYFTPDRTGGRVHKLQKLFLDCVGRNTDYPKKGEGGRWSVGEVYWNKHHLRTIALDSEILKNKCNRIRWRDRLDIWTKKGRLRKSDNIVGDIYDARMLAIGMSSTSPNLYFVGFQVSHSQLTDRLMSWSWNGCSYHQLLKGQHPKIRPVLIDTTPLTPEDYVGIFGEKKEGQRKEKIDKALIANFPLTQSV